MKTKKARKNQSIDRTGRMTDMESGSSKRSECESCPSKDSEL